MTKTFNLINTNTKILQDNNNHEISSIYLNKTSSSFEDSQLTFESYNDGSFLINNNQIQRDNRYIKHFKSNRNDDHITSLKRRVRKQQLRHDQNQVTTCQENTFQLSPSPKLFLLSYPQQSVSPCYYKTKKSSCVVPLPPLINNMRASRTHVHGIKLNLYGY